MSDATAWLLELNDGLLAAVGELELIHLLPDKPLLFELPQSPVYCRSLCVWRGEILPLMDLAARILELPTRTGEGLLAVVAFQKYPGAKIHHGALVLNAPPIRIHVNDSQSCDLPDSPVIWQDLAIACFELAERGPVPILDLVRVYSQPPADTLVESNLTDSRYLSKAKAAIDTPTKLGLHESPLTTLPAEPRTDLKE